MIIKLLHSLLRQYRGNAALFPYENGFLNQEVKLNEMPSVSFMDWDTLVRALIIVFYVHAYVFRNLNQTNQRLIHLGT